MAYKTKLQVETKIKRDMDLEEEEFIQAAELTEYVNDAISEVEAMLITLGLRDQYLLTRTTLNLVSGTADYSLPSNLYEGKIKSVTYSNGATIYKIHPITADDAAEEIEHMNRFSTTEWYRYRIRNDASDSIYFQLVPSARATETGTVIIEYYRDLERVSADADLVEVPEIAYQYIYRHVKTAIYEKESHANFMGSAAKLEQLEKRLIDTLTNQIIDEGEELIQMDQEIYVETS